MVLKPKRREAEETCSVPEFVKRLRDLADTLERGHALVLDVAGETIEVPAHAVLSVEHERDPHEEEIEFQIKWKHKV